MGTLPTPALTDLLLDRFIARTEPMAMQSRTGIYVPVRDKAFNEKYLAKHIAGDVSLGHYLLDAQSQCKLFAFDIDLNVTGEWLEYPTGKNLESFLDDFPNPGPAQDAAFDHLTTTHRGVNPRELWQDKRGASRAFLMKQMRELIEMFSSKIYKELGLPVAAAYSGNKGVHVYAFHDLMPASDSRLLAYAVMESFDRFSPLKGDNFFCDTVKGAADGYSNFTIEIFPKQDHVSEDGLGNLMRLPFGKNLKSPDSFAFLIDQTAALNLIKPAKNPEQILVTGNPWLDQA